MSPRNPPIPDRKSSIFAWFSACFCSKVPFKLVNSWSTLRSVVWVSVCFWAETPLMFMNSCSAWVLLCAIKFLIAVNSWSTLSDKD